MGRKSGKRGNVSDSADEYVGVVCSTEMRGAQREAANIFFRTTFSRSTLTYQGGGQVAQHCEHAHVTRRARASVVPRAAVARQHLAIRAHVERRAAVAPPYTVNFTAPRRVDTCSVCAVLAAAAHGRIAHTRARRCAPQPRLPPSLRQLVPFRTLRSHMSLAFVLAPPPCGRFAARRAAAAAVPAAVPAAAPRSPPRVRCCERRAPSADGPQLSPRMADLSMLRDDRRAMGFTTYAERVNGRAAMLGFVAAVAIELVAGRGLVALLEALLARA